MQLKAMAKVLDLKSELELDDNHGEMDMDELKLLLRPQIKAIRDMHAQLTERLALVKEQMTTTSTPFAFDEEESREKEALEELARE